VRGTGRSIWRYSRTWIPLSIVIGAISGLGAAAFYAFLHFCMKVVLGGVVGHFPATLAGEGGFRPSSGFSVVWAVPLVVAAGALLGTILVRWLAPEAAGHGTDAAIRSIHHDPSGTPVRVGWVKLLASGVTIGSGGSGGSEGPAAQITAATASFVARVFKLPFDRAKTAVTVGLGAGVGAIFRTPFAGALLGAEMIYRADIAVNVIVPGLIASGVAFGVFGLIHDFAPIFGTVDDFRLGVGILIYPVLGLLAGLVGRLYITTFHGSVALFAKPSRRLPPLTRPAVAGLAVGGLGIVVPGVLGTGYGTAQAVLDAGRLLDLSLWLVLLIPFAKILATSLSIGSGGSGGIFGPGLVIGATTGAAVWRLVEPFGLAPPSPAPFVIAGMAACLGSIARAPVALIVMVVEATSNVSMLLPTMIATGVACLVVGDRTLYRSQLRSRADAPTGPLTEWATGPTHVHNPRPATGAPRFTSGPGRQRLIWVRHWAATRRRRGARRPPRDSHR
jgi:CIC family chloride channel protein